MSVQCIAVSVQRIIVGVRVTWQAHEMHTVNRFGLVHVSDQNLTCVSSSSLSQLYIAYMGNLLLYPRLLSTSYMYATIYYSTVYI